MKKDKYTLDDIKKAKCYAERCLGLVKDCLICKDPCKGGRYKEIIFDVLDTYYKECMEYVNSLNHYTDVTLVQDLGLTTIMKNRLENSGLLTDADVYKRVKTENGYNWEVLKKLRGCGPKTYSGIVEFFSNYFKEKNFEGYSDMLSVLDLKVLGFLLKYTKFNSLIELVNHFYNSVEDEVNSEKLDSLLYDLGRSLIVEGRCLGVYNGNDGDFILKVEHLIMKYRFLYTGEKNEEE